MTGWRLSGLIGLATVIFFLLQVLPAHDDISWFRDWTTTAAQSGYRHLAERTSFNYLPAFLPIIWLSNAGEGLLRSAGLEADFTTWWRSLHYILEVVLLLWLLALARPLLRPQERFMIAVLFLLNPFFIWLAWVWGQVDLLLLLLWMISLVYLARANYLPFAAVSLFLILLKPTGLLLLPAQLLLLAVTAVGRSAYRRLLLWGGWFLAGGLIVSAPLVPSLIDWLSTRAAWGQATSVSYNAFNFWFLLRGEAAAQTLWHGLSYQIWGALLATVILIPLTIGLFRAVSASRHFRARQVIELATGYAAIYAATFVLLLTDMHERYWGFVLAPLTIAAVLIPAWRWLLGALTATFFLNLVLIFPSAVPTFGAWQSQWVNLGLALSWGHLLLYLALSYHWLRLTAGPKS